MSRPDPHIIGLCPSTSYLLQMYIKSRMNKRPEKKTTVFTKKICKFKTSYYLCNTKFQRWIHLRVRIRASHARHRGSNPLSTTKSDCNSRSFYYCLSGVTGQGKFGQTEQRGPYELRSSRRVVTFEDRRSEINSLSTTENNCNRSLFILHSKAPAQKPESDSSRMHHGAMRKSFISTQDNGSRQRKKRSLPSSARTPCRKFIGTKNSPESEQRKS